MSLEDKLTDILTRFEEATTGVMGTSVITRAQALMMVATSQQFDQDVIQGMSVRFLRLAMDTLEPMVDDPVLQAVTIEEENYFIFIRPINDQYYIVSVTDKSELSGVRISNLDKLIEQLRKAIGG